ncbi:hypothetical protein [Natrarchaeobaculum aegyptiacum]|uniref:Uncharacterized protein n=1 Tax=Natrarchaeobaculum aegyptiacum TaxID=745377 RepID=A0A2Z2HWW5_9EURY|nr:hypothetical protein [Natrarchaeobaculum aegyptiacum]ARS90675.1 hypothetical protein B1756_13680 [Natrarchaeobaculum aegyptiacum]
MTELTIPTDADQQQASRLVREHVEVGDLVRVTELERTGSDDPELTAEVTAVEPGHLELDGEGADGRGFRYDEIHTLTRVESESKPDSGPN